MSDASTPPPVPAGPATPGGSALPRVVREVEDFASAAGWDQPPQLFALVDTAQLLARQPELGSALDQDSPFTPVAQEPLPDTDLAAALAGIVWPDTVSGCAVVQEIVVLPPDAEAELGIEPDYDDSDDEPDDGSDGPDAEPADSDAATDAADSERMRRIAAEHPQRREARLVAGVLRDGTAACVLRLRGDADTPDEIVEHPELAPNLIRALRETLAD